MLYNDEYLSGHVAKWRAVAAKRLDFGNTSQVYGEEHARVWNNW